MRNLSPPAFALLLSLASLVGCSKDGSSPTSVSNPSSTASNPAANPSTSGQNPTPVPVPEPPPPPRPTSIPTGTEITISLQQPLGSKTSQDGQRFDTAVAIPVLVNDKTVIPKRASASGTVAEAHAAGRFKGGATLNLELNAVTIGGKHYAIRTMALTAETKGKGKRSAGMVGGGAGGGAAIGAIAGGGKGAAIVPPQPNHTHFDLTASQAAASESETSTRIQMRKCGLRDGPGPCIHCSI